MFNANKYLRVRELEQCLEEFSPEELNRNGQNDLYDSTTLRRTRQEERMNHGVEMDEYGTIYNIKTNKIDIELTSNYIK